MKAIVAITAVLSLFGCELGKVANTAPTDIKLNPATIVENSIVGTEIGTITAKDAEGDTITYQLGGTDADKFTVDGDKLKNSVVFDYDSGVTEYSITILAKDSEGNSSQEDFTVAVTNTLDEDGEVNTAPTDIALSKTTLPENTTFVGVLSAEDTTPGDDAIVYTLSGDDADSFEIVDGELFFSIAPDFETKTSYAITVTADDGYEENNTASADFTVEVTDLINEDYMAYWSLDSLYEATGIYNLSDNADDEETTEVETSGDFLTEGGIAGGHLSVKDDIGSYYLAGTKGTEAGTTFDFSKSTSDSFSISFWIKQASESVEADTYPCIFEYSDSSTLSGYRVILRPDGKVSLRVFSADTDSTTMSSTGSKYFKDGQYSEIRSAVVTDDAWHHIVCVFNAGNMYIYSDGSLDSSATGALLEANAKSGGDNFSFAGYSSTAGNNPGGISLDEVYFFDKSLTEDEVTDLGLGL